MDRADKIALLEIVKEHPRVITDKINVVSLFSGTFRDDVRGDFNVFEIENDRLGRNRLIYTEDDIVELHSIESLRKALLQGTIGRYDKQSYVKKDK